MRADRSAPRSLMLIAPSRTQCRVSGLSAVGLHQGPTGPVLGTGFAGAVTGARGAGFGLVVFLPEPRLFDLFGLGFTVADLRLALGEGERDGDLRARLEPGEGARHVRAAQLRAVGQAHALVRLDAEHGGLLGLPDLADDDGTGDHDRDRVDDLDRNALVLAMSHANDRTRADIARPVTHLDLARLMIGTNDNDAMGAGSGNDDATGLGRCLLRGRGRSGSSQQAQRNEGAGRRAE